MNIIIPLFVFVGLIYTIYKYYKWIKGNYIIPTGFFYNWKFLLHVASMIAIAIAFFYAKQPLSPTIFICLIIGMVLGMINATVSTSQKVTD